MVQVSQVVAGPTHDDLPSSGGGLGTAQPRGRAVRTGVTGSALVRLLARLTDVDVADSSQSFSDRLSQWLRWTDAIALSSALDGAQPSVLDPAGANPVEAEMVACARVRATLARAIADDVAFLGDRRATPLDGKKSDFAPFRVRYHARQQAMEAGVASLRTRVRAALAERSAAMARLASVDAVMEQALAVHERSLLATVPGLLERRFRGLRQASLDSGAEVPDADAWQDAFCDDMQAVMLAELDIRLQPVEGLLEALRKT